MVQRLDEVQFNSRMRRCRGQVLPFASRPRTKLPDNGPKAPVARGPGPCRAGLAALVQVGQGVQLWAQGQRQQMYLGDDDFVLRMLAIASANGGVRSCLLPSGDQVA